MSIAISLFFLLLLIGPLVVGVLRADYSSDGARRQSRTRATLIAFSTVCAIVLLFATGPTLLTFVAEFSGYSPSRSIFPSAWSHVPAWLVHVGMLTTPLVLIILLPWAWWLYGLEKFTTVRVIIAVGIFWLIPDALFVIGMVCDQSNSVGCGIANSVLRALILI